MVHDSITLHIDTSSKVKYDKICMLTSNAEIYPGKKHDILKIDVSLLMCALG